MGAAGVFYVFAALVVVFLVAFVAFYSVRLVRAREVGEKSTEERLAAVIRPGLEQGTQSSDADQATDPTVSAPPVREYEAGPGLRAITDEVVFMKRGRDGEVAFQLGDKPSMPLRFLLDAKARTVLTELATRASADFGEHWGILASEDPDGRLKITRVF